MIVEYTIVALHGVLLGASELLSRYRDEPKALFRLPPAYLYVAFNALIGMAALYLIGVFGWGAAADAANPMRQTVYNILIAGFGGAAFFRSSIAKTKLGDVEVGVGPSFVIDTFLAVTDRAIDRRRAMKRTSLIPQLMRPIPPEFSAGALTQYCIGAMQNLAAADEKILDTRTTTIVNSSTLPASVRSMLIGMTLLEYVGAPVLEEAIAELDEEIKAAIEQRKKREAGPDVDQIMAAMEAGDDKDEETTDTAAGAEAQPAEPAAPELKPVVAPPPPKPKSTNG